MKKFYLFLILGLLTPLFSVFYLVQAAPTVNILGNTAVVGLKATTTANTNLTVSSTFSITGLAGGGTLCLHVDNNGKVGVTASDCGSASAGVTSLNAYASGTVTIAGTGCISISTSSPSTLTIDCTGGSGSTTTINGLQPGTDRFIFTGTNIGVASTAPGTINFYNNGVTAFNSATGSITYNAVTSVNFTFGDLSLGLASSGTVPYFYNNGGNMLFSIPQAGTASSGYLSATDWNHFNNGVDSVNGATGTVIIASGGVTSLNDYASGTVQVLGTNGVTISTTSPNTVTIDAVGLVPYTGAINTLDLGIQSLITTADVSAGTLTLTAKYINFNAPGSYGMKVGEDAPNTFSIYNDNASLYAALSIDNLRDTNKTFLFPNESGTFVMGTGTPSNCATWTSTNTITDTGSPCGAGGAGVSKINNYASGSVTFVGAGTVTVSTTSPNTITITGTAGAGVPTTTIAGLQPPTNTFLITTTNLGIGTTSPNTINLYNQGVTSLNGATGTVSTATSTSGGGFTVSGNTIKFPSYLDPIVSTSTLYTAAGFANSVSYHGATTSQAIDLGLNDSAYRAAGSGTVGGSGAANQVMYWQNSNTAAGDANHTWASSSQLLAITGSSTISGRLGVGTTTPATLLHVYGDVSGGVATLERTNAATNAALGTVKIKANSSGVVADGFGAAFQFYIQGSGTAESYLADIRGLRSGADNSGALTFSTANAGVTTEKFRVTPAGNVGIGTGVPSTTLHVIGGAQFTDLSVNGLIYASSTGRLAQIATSTVGYVLMATSSFPGFSWEKATGGGSGTVTNVNGITPNVIIVGGANIGVASSSQTITISGATSSVPYSVEFPIVGEDDVIMSFDSAATLVKAIAVNKTSGDSFTWNLCSAASRQQATTTCNRMAFSSYNVTTATTTPSSYTPATTTINAGDVMRLVGTSASSSQFNVTIWYTTP